MQRQEYEEKLPDWCNMNGADRPLYTESGVQIAKKYDRVVIGDYGAFVEIAHEDMIAFNVKIKPGEEYRILDPEFSERVKYLWYTTVQAPFVKLYYQKKTVPYADYIPGKWYISPYEIHDFSNNSKGEW